MNATYPIERMSRKPGSSGSGASTSTDKSRTRKARAQTLERRRVRQLKAGTAEFARMTSVTTMELR